MGRRRPAEGKKGGDDSFTPEATELTFHAGRDPLLKARSALNCLVFAMTYRESGDPEGAVDLGEFATVAEVILALLDKSIQQFDCAELEMAGVMRGGSHGRKRRRTRE